MNGNSGYRYEDLVRGHIVGNVSTSPTNHHVPQPNIENLPNISKSLTTPGGYPDSEVGYIMESSSLVDSPPAMDWSNGFKQYDNDFYLSGHMSIVNTNVPTFFANQNIGQITPAMTTSNEPFLGFPSGPQSFSPGPFSFQGQALSSSPMNAKALKADDGQRGTSYSRTVMDQLRKDFLNASPLKPPQQNEQKLEQVKSNNFWKESFDPSLNTKDGGPFNEGTVLSFKVPQMHHAEVVTLRHDTSSESGDETMRLAKMGIPPPMQSLPYFSPPPLISPQFQSLGCHEDPFTQQLEELRQRHIMEQQQLEREFEEKRKRLAEEELRLASLLPQSATIQPHQPQGQGSFFSPSHHGKPHIPNKFNSKNNYQLLQKPVIRKPQQYPSQLQPILGSERSFDDQSPVINSDENLPITQPDHASTPIKKKNFLSQFFKKPTPSPPKPKKEQSSKKSKKQKNCENINNSFKDDEGEEEDEEDRSRRSPMDTSTNRSSTASELKLSTLERSPHRLSPSTPRTNPYDRPWMTKNESMVTHPGSSLEQTMGSMSDFAEVESQNVPSGQLPRKLSMSKPTNIDELERQAEDKVDEGIMKHHPSTSLQKFVDQRKTQTADDVFRNDPWFQKEMQSNSKLPLLNLQMAVDTTQEIDLDQELENGENYEDNEPLTCRQIEEIIWPKSEHESDEDEESIEAIPSHQKPGINIKAAFLKLGDIQLSKKIEMVAKRKSHELKSPPENKPSPDEVELDDQDPGLTGNETNDKVPKEGSGNKKIGLVSILKRPSWRIPKTVKKVPIIETKTEKLEDPLPVDDSDLNDDGFTVEEDVTSDPVVEISEPELRIEAPDNIVEVVQHEHQDEEPEMDQSEQENFEETLVDEDTPPPQEKFSTSFKQRMSFRLKKGFKKSDANEKEAGGQNQEFSPTSAFNKIKEKLAKRDISHENQEAQEDSPKPSLNDMLQQKLHLQRPIFKIKYKKSQTNDEDDDGGDDVTNELANEGQIEEGDPGELKDLQEVTEEKLKAAPPSRPFFRMKPKKEKNDSNEEHLVKATEKDEEKTKTPPKMKSPKKDDSKRQPPGKFFRTPSWKGPSSSKKSPKQTSPESKLDKSFESNKSASNLEENDNLPTIEVYQSPPKGRLDLPEEDTSSPTNQDSARTSETDCQEELSATPDNMDLQAQQELVEVQEGDNGTQLDAEMVTDVDKEEYVDVCDDLNNVTLTDEQIQASISPPEADEAVEATDDEPVTVVVFPVERNEPVTTEKEKSFKKGFAGLFKVSLSAKEKLTNEEPAQNEDKEPELGGDEDEDEHLETGNAFSGRRMPMSKSSLSGLFASKRRSKSKPELQKASAVQDNHEILSKDDSTQEKEEPPQPAVFQRRQHGSTLGNLFGSMRAVRAKSIGSLADKIRSPNNQPVDPEGQIDKKRSHPDLKEQQSPPRQAMKSARKLVSMFSKSTDGHEKPIMGSNLSDSDVEYTEEPYRRRPNPNVSFQNSPEPDAGSNGSRLPSPEPPSAQEEEVKPTQFMPQRQAVSPGRIAVSRPTVPPPPPLNPSRQQNTVQLPGPPQAQTRPAAVEEDQGASNRQMGRRSGRFRKPNETNTESGEHHRISGPLLPPPGSAQSMMRDLFAESMAKRAFPAPPSIAPSNISYQDSIAASSLGGDYEYEKAIRGSSSRSRPKKKPKEK